MINRDDISCWIPPIKPFGFFDDYTEVGHECPVTGIRPAKGYDAWVQFNLYGTDRVAVAGATFELFDACNHYRNPDDELLDPYLSRLAQVEGVSSRELHVSILQCQIDGLQKQGDAVSKQWAEALACWVVDLQKS